MRFGCGRHSVGSGCSPVAGFCEHGNEPSVSKNKPTFFDLLINYQLLNENLLHGVIPIGISGRILHT
jgi:hypothetical protein